MVKSFVVAEEVPKTYPKHFTARKEYAIVESYKGGNLFKVVDDFGSTRLCRLVGCSYLGHKNWILLEKEVTEDE
tara:strand:- start:102 stop:323 length:222 start_codon:yes stop_codon:yes gene_type:complete